MDIPGGERSANPTVAPPSEEIPPYLNFAPLDNAATALSQAAAHYSRALAATQGKALRRTW